MSIALFLNNSSYFIHLTFCLNQLFIIASFYLIAAMSLEFYWICQTVPGIFLLISTLNYFQKCHLSSESLPYLTIYFIGHVIFFSLSYSNNVRSEFSTNRRLTLVLRFVHRCDRKFLFSDKQIGLRSRQSSVYLNCKILSDFHIVYSLLPRCPFCFFPKALILLQYWMNTVYQTEQFPEELQHFFIQRFFTQ